MKYSKELHNYLQEGQNLAEGGYEISSVIECLLDEIERLQSWRRWIPVSERLPETNKDVLVLTRFGTCEVAGKYPNGWVAATVAVWKTVTHWMPLPVPPEATDEN